MRPGESRPEQVVAQVAAAVGSVVAQAADGARVLGVGVSVPGQVDRETGVAVYAPNWDWHDVPLLDLLSEVIAYPLYLDNPLRAGTVAEMWFGAARGRGDAVVVNLGTGVGAGLALGRALHRGVSNSAGEWVPPGRRSRCRGPARGLPYDVDRDRIALGDALRESVDGRRLVVRVQQRAVRVPLAQIAHDAGRSDIRLDAAAAAAVARPPVQDERGVAPLARAVAHSRCSAPPRASPAPTPVPRLTTTVSPRPRAGAGPSSAVVHGASGCLSRWSG